MNRVRRPLRLKLTIWYVLVFLALQVALLGTVVLVRSEWIRRSLDDALGESAAAMVENLLNSDTDWSDEHVRQEIPADAGFLLYVVRDADGEILTAWDTAAAAEVRFSPWENVPAGPVGPVYTAVGPERAERLTGERTRLRLVTVPFRNADGLFYLQAAVKDPLVDRLLGPFVDAFVIGVPVGVLAAALAAWMIAGRAVRPLDRLALVARSVSPARLDRRFDEAASDVEISRLTDELNRALERLEAGYRSQDQFISNVSHELKTPIAVLLLEAQVARMGGPRPADATAFVAHAERELKRLSRIVESFLVLARTQLTGNRPLPAVSVNDLVLQAVRHGRALAEKKDVRLVANLESPDDGALEPNVSGDNELLQTMIDNLVRNAIAHSPPGEAVAIDAGRRGDSVHITVRDRGPGIPEEYKERVFERFMQVPGGEETERGTGLGLAIASEVVRVHGGTIAIEEREQGGCSFLVVLPARGAED